MPDRSYTRGRFKIPPRICQDACQTLGLNDSHSRAELTLLGVARVVPAGLMNTLSRFICYLWRGLLAGFAARLSSAVPAPKRPPLRQGRSASSGVKNLLWPAAHADVAGENPALTTTRTTRRSNTSDDEQDHQAGADRHSDCGGSHRVSRPPHPPGLPLRLSRRRETSRAGWRMTSRDARCLITPMRRGRAVARRRLSPISASGRASR
jgi:hypothetical protein